MESRNLSAGNVRSGKTAVSTQIARAALHSLGLIGCLRWLRRNGVRILMYHRFDRDPAHLTRQCEHVRRHYMPISLGDIAASYREGRSLPPNALAVTVDDGYRDFLTSGQPVLRAFDIPATVFLVSDFIDGGFWLWWDMFAYVVERTSQTELTCSMPDGSTRRFTLNSPAERRAAYATISAELTHFDARVRLRSLAELSGRLEVTVPRDPPSEYAPLTWGDVRSLADQGVEFGAHTRTHPILSCVGDPQQLRDEVISSKLRIEQETGRPVVHFCYPNGRREDFGDDAVEVVREGGFQTAVTTEPGINFPGQPPLLLRRIGVQPDYPIPYVEELLAGVRSS